MSGRGAARLADTERGTGHDSADCRSCPWSGGGPIMIEPVNPMMMVLIVSGLPAAYRPMAQVQTPRMPGIIAGPPFHTWPGSEWFF